MHCPNCGKKFSHEQKFCRACGLSLEKVSTALAEQLKVETDVLTPEEAAGLAERQRKVEGWLGLAVLGFVAVLVISVIAGIIYGMLSGKIPLWKGVASLSIIFMAFTALSLVIYNESLKDRLEQARRARTTLPAGGTTARLLEESRIEPVPSVTERTTDLLPVESGGERREF